MLRLLGWTIAVVAVGVLLWQSTDAEPILPRWLSALLLVAIGLMAGLRIGADSASLYIRDLQRHNRVLAAQNRELEEANSLLLNQVSEVVHAHSGNAT
jgi:hypothetical protein